MAKSVTYIVLVAGRYNNQRGKAGDYSEGDVLTASPTYGASLVADGLIAAPLVPGRERATLPVQVVVVGSEEILASGVDILADVVGLSDSALLNLKTAGFETIADVGGASDKDLLSIVGIGPAALRKIRECLEGVLEEGGGV